MSESLRRTMMTGARLVVGTALLALVAGCATYQARSVQKSGFLGDYSQLRPGKDGEAQLVYFNPRADFRRYRKILLDPVAIAASRAKESAFVAMDKKEQQVMVNYVDAMVRAKLGKSYLFVTKPGPDVMRLRIAITEVQGASVVLDTVSSIVPFALALSTVKRIALDAHTGVGKAGVEMELKDSTSGVRLAAAVDAQVGRKFTFLFDKFSTYRTFDDAFDMWTTRLQERLAKVRSAGPAAR